MPWVAYTCSTTFADFRCGRSGRAPRSCSVSKTARSRAPSPVRSLITFHLSIAVSQAQHIFDRSDAHVDIFHSAYRRARRERPILDARAADQNVDPAVRGLNRRKSPIEHRSDTRTSGGA